MSLNIRLLNRECSVCGAEFSPVNNRQRACPDCTEEAARRTRRQRRVRTLQAVPDPEGTLICRYCEDPAVIGLCRGCLGRFAPDADHDDFDSEDDAADAWLKSHMAS